MSKMTTHEPINYLDSILNEEEKRCEFGHQWRQFTISRSGRFKSKNKKRDIIDGKIFDASEQRTTMTSTTMEPVRSCDANNSHNRSNGGITSSAYNKDHDNNMISSKQFLQSSNSKQSMMYGKPGAVQGGSKAKSTESYKSFYETNL